MQKQSYESQDREPCKNILDTEPHFLDNFFTVTQTVTLNNASDLSGYR